VSRVLHVLDHSLPEQSGYASRSHSILRALTELGIDVAALTGPKQGGAAGRCDKVDGIRYWRAPSPAGRSTSGVSGQLRTIRYTRRGILDRIAADGVVLLHAHSPCLNGLAVVRTGRPFVYEMRSSWEDAAVSNGQTRENSARYRLSRMLENAVARRAAAVTVICEGLKMELVARGLEPEKITVVPNALPEHMFERANADAVADLRKRLDLGNGRTIGFFGSFFEWEGIDVLVEAMPAVLASVPDACLLLAGGGRQEVRLRRRAAELGIDRAVVFAGRLSSADVRACYGAADLMVFPRISMRLTEMVTPLKPLEAMAQRVPVLASGVGGHRELIDDGRTGYLYPAGDRDALIRRIVELLGTRDPLPVVESAHAWVVGERRWSAVAERYLPIYDRLIARSTTCRAGRRGPAN